MKILVTGAAGFIGSHLCETLAKNHKIVGIDNLSTGNIENLELLKNSKEFEFVKEDCTNYDAMLNLCKEIDVVYHLAANPEVRLEKQNHDLSFSQNVISTKVLLDVCVRNNIKKMIFTSTSTVYGEPSKVPTSESYGPLKPISVYGGTKLASEAIISAYCFTFKMNGIILRLANIIGPRSGHGVIFDFINKLQENKKNLEILGDGTQKKSFMYIDDCISAILIASKTNGFEIFNIGSEDQIDVTTIANEIVKLMNCSPTLRYTGGVDGGRGWIGDVKNMFLDISKIKKIGFKPKLNSLMAVRKTTSEVINKK